MKKVGKVIIGVLMSVIMLLGANLSLAVTQDEINQQKNEQKEIEEQKKKVEEEKKKVSDQKNVTQQEVNKLNNQIDQYQTQIDSLDSQIKDANTKIAEQEENLKKAQQDYEKQQKTLEERLVAIYEAGETTYLDVLLSSEGVTDFISNYYVVSQIAQCDLEMLDKINQQKQEIEKVKQDIEKSKTELTNAKASKQSVSKELQVAKKEKDSQVANLSAEEKELQKEIEALQAANRKIANDIVAAEKKFAQQIKDLQEQQNKPSGGGNSGGSSNNGGGNSSASSGFFMRPINGGYVSANGYYSDGSFHGAIDYAVSSGTPVYAAATGVVMSTANLSTSYGTYVVIRHANGLQSYYAHGTYGSICVSPGQTVQKGQQIMRSGNTGHSFGPHLHFEVRKSPYSYSYSATAYGQDSRVNPTSYM